MDSGLVRELRALIGDDAVQSSDAARRVYDCDAYTLEKHAPEAIVFPKTTDEVQSIVRWCVSHSVPYTPRGAGTGLSGGSLPLFGGVIVSLTRMRTILEIDIPNRMMLAQCGCPNIALTRAVEQHGLHFAPDPSSQTVCTLGGNISENSGGPHTLKYGVTTDHVTGITLVDCSGEIRRFGGRVFGAPGLDLVGFIVGSEGTLGIVTEAWVRLTPTPTNVETILVVFSSTNDATNTVSDVIASGIIPAAMEFMDSVILEAVEAAFHVGLPTNAGALLLIECDSFDDSATMEIARISEICKTRNAIEIRRANNAKDRSDLWIARKKGIGAIGRITPSMVTHDGVIPRSKLPEVLEFVYEVAREEGLRVANIFHAGDGNLHPIFLFDERVPEQVEAVNRAGERVLRRCIQEGGSVSGEHGIGVEKIDLLGEMYSERDLRMQEDLRACFNTNNLCNPGKILPSQKSCVEVRLRKRAAH